MIDLQPFRHEAQFAMGETMLYLVIDVATVSRLEALTSRSIDELLEEVFKSTGVAAQFVWAAAQESQPGLTLDQVGGIMFASGHGQALMVTLGDLVKRAFFKAASVPNRRTRRAAKAA